MNSESRALENLETELKKYDEIIKHLEELISNFEENLIQHTFNLNELKKDIDDQLLRLQKKTYEIAVVGTEKAGKSSLLNAWIGFDLLPSDEKRCTYTTTEIRSVSSVEEQKYTIEYFTQDEFKKSEFEKKLSENEFREIKTQLEEAERYLNKDVETVSCKDFKNERDKLREAICKPSKALAIKKICIYVRIENIDANIIFFDVPGYDSPITLHKEQTEAKIAAADAVLYVKRFIKPNLVDSELAILKICDSTNPYIKAKDKLIVALTGGDQAASAKKYEKLLNDNFKIWKEYDLKQWRIVPVCSLAEIASDSDETKRIRMLLEQNNGGKTGFKELKEAVTKCVIDTRVEIANERFACIPNKIKDISTKVFNCTRNQYNIDEKTEIKASLSDDEMKKIYKEWWSKKWKGIEEDFQDFFQSDIRPKKNADESNFLSEEDFDFKDLYDTIVDETFESVNATKKERQEKIYKSCNHDDGIIDPNKGNMKIRSELAQEFINSLDKVTDKLNKFMWNKINKMIDWMRRELWHIPEIRDEMIGKDSNIENLLFKKSFEALIQRLARPATNIFIANPRTPTVRKRIMKEYIMELMTLNKFIEDGEICEIGIIKFLACGQEGEFELKIKKKSNLTFDLTSSTSQSKLLTSKTVESIESGIDTNKLLEESFEDAYSDDNVNISKIKPENRSNKPLLSIEPLNQFENLDFKKLPEVLSEVQEEIEEDINEFLKCMKNSIFYGSGIQRFYSSELDKFKRKFLELENNSGRWRHYFEIYVKKNDPRVKIPAPTLAEEQRQRERISESIKAIQKIYETIYINQDRENQDDLVLDNVLVDKNYY